MSSPVRLRGEVGERRVERFATSWSAIDNRYVFSLGRRPDPDTVVYDQWNDNRRTGRSDRRTSPSPRTAELAAELERLRGFIAALEENNERMRAEARLLTSMLCDTAELAKGQQEGSHERD